MKAIDDITLETTLSSVFRLKDTQKKALLRLQIETVHDLIFYFPHRYSNITEVSTIEKSSEGDTVTIFGTVLSSQIKKTWKNGLPSAEAIIEDIEGNTIKAIWLHQAYIAKEIPKGTHVSFTGKISEKNGAFSMFNPEFEKKETMAIDSHSSLFNTEQTAEFFGYPIYPESRGITSKWIYHSVRSLISSGVIDTVKDYMPEDILTKYNLPSLKESLVWIHMPRKKSHADAAKKRFSFEEIFLIQTERALQQKKHSQEKSYNLSIDKERTSSFMERFPFDLTSAQRRVIDECMSDMNRPHPMMRFLQGDVGSGKTAVAATLAHSVAMTRPTHQDFGRLQVAYMAPTEVLAMQLFESFIEYFKHTPLKIALITGSGCRIFPSKSNPSTWTKISKAQLVKWVANGEIAVVLGTHALIYKSVAFKHLALSIIDEQHRFGINQRALFAKKDDTLPHLLSMSATPIPRTLALTMYGDLDISLLDELPKGRKKIETKLVEDTGRDEMYKNIRKLLKEGRQVYIICPRIDAPDPDKATSLMVKSVIEETKRLQNIFPEQIITSMHGKLKKDEKESIMKDFEAEKTNILVSTSVIEVGVNVPNATCIIIEGAERFGLAQLHQLRGRVQRGSYQPYCYLLSSSLSEKSRERLRSFCKIHDGFTLAEKDLLNRGSGALSAKNQWGISDIGMDALRNIQLVEFARKEAKHLVEIDPLLQKHSLLYQEIKRKGYILHFE
ncbi:MAG: ATP-dependent DNA helicase RecG [Flavobacteriaceae bacterium]|jgi:ATP-dependent DNA helicase RecG